MRAANDDAIRRTVEGAPVDAGGRHRDGLRIVVNVPCAVVPDVFVRGVRNRHELSAKRVGDERSTRNRLDDAIADIAAQFAGDATPGAQPIDPTALHYAALELNGAGVRYFGDICLVIDSEGIDDSQVVLEQNSYNVTRDPLRPDLADDAAVRDALVRMACRWADRAELVARKVLAASPESDERLLTTAAVGRGILEDEEYIEVPLTTAIAPDRIRGARTTGGEAAKELSIAATTATVAPSATDLLWLSSRRRAAQALREHAIPLSIVTHGGRERS
ncbi:hypothetical protein ACFQ0P_02505 [Microbacterium insulae]|uniref:Uncharacterized protein n=1 Tax=Microbacterium insulae TaxID=483014 RepID=A0ABW3AEG8_9MICO